MWEFLVKLYALESFQPRIVLGLVLGLVGVFVAVRFSEKK